MLKTSTLWRQIYIINSVDETKLSCNTPPLPPTPTLPSWCSTSFFTTLLIWLFICHFYVHWDITQLESLTGTKEANVVIGCTFSDSWHLLYPENFLFASYIHENTLMSKQMVNWMTKFSPTFSLPKTFWISVRRLFTFQFISKVELQKSKNSSNVYSLYIAWRTSAWKREIFTWIIKMINQCFYFAVVKLLPKH